MPYTKIEIISQSVTLLGHAPITTLETAGTIGQVFNNRFDLILESELKKYGWRFCVKVASLSRLTESTGIDDYSYQYNLPSDFLSIVQFYPNTSDYKIFGNKIFANFSESTDVKIEYRAKINVLDLPSHFVNYFVYRLAEQYALAVPQFSSYVQLMNQYAEKELGRSLAADAQDNPASFIKSSPFIEARYSNSSIGSRTIAS